MVDRSVECPRCGEEVVPLRIMYGYPTLEAFEAAERGEFRLGGCVVGDESPDYACPSCDASLPFVAPEKQVRARAGGPR